MRRSLARSEQAVSDIVGTILLIGVAATFAGVVALEYAAGATGQAPPLRIEARAFADASGIDLIHLGGTTLDASEIRVIVSTNAGVHQSGPGGASGVVWGTGGVLRIPLTSPLPPGIAEIALVHVARGETLTTLGVGSASSSGGSGATMTLDVILDGSTSAPTVVPPTQVLAEVKVTHSDGRKLVRSVHADLSDLDGPVWSGLRDDGTRGDRVAGDGTWSGLLNVPLSATPGDHQVVFVAEDLYGATATRTATIRVT